MDGDRPLNQDIFLYGSRNGTGPVQKMRAEYDYYMRLSGAFRLKGMEIEADLFAEVAHEYAALGDEIAAKLERRTTLPANVQR